MNNPIIFENVSYAVKLKDGLERPVINSLSSTLQFTENGIIVIAGNSGSGKTAIAGLISGLVKPENGSVRLPDNLSHAPLIPAQPSLIPWLTVQENINFFSDPENKENSKNIGEIISLAGLEGYENHHPLDTNSGMVFRIALARAMKTGSNLIVIDGALSALKHRAKEECMELIKKLAGSNELQFIIMTSQLSEAQWLTENIYVLSQNGVTSLRSVAEETPATVRNIF